MTPVVFISHSAPDLRSERALIEKALLFYEDLQAELRNRDFEVINTWDNQKDVDGKESSLDLIRSCDLLLAIVNENVSNVLLELGYAMGIGKQVLIVSPPNKELPPDLLNIRSIQAHSFDVSLINRIINTLDVLVIPENRTVEKYIDPDSAYKIYLHNPDHFEQMNYKAFEDLVYQWLKISEFDLERIKGSNDCGYDFLVRNYKGVNKTLIELKKLNKNSRVSVNQVQQFMGVLEAGHADRGIFITTSDFTEAAKAFVNNTNAQIELWTLGRLFKELSK